MQKTLEAITEWIAQEEDDKELILYGLGIAVEYFFGFITMLAVSILFGLLKEGIAFITSFYLIRSYAGGYHCQTAFRCYLLSTSVVVFVFTVITITPSENITLIASLITMISAPVILMLAPLDTPNKPLDEIEYRHCKKKTVLYLCVETLLIVILLAIGIDTIALTIALCFLVTSIGLIASKVQKAKQN